MFLKKCVLVNENEELINFFYPRKQALVCHSGTKSIFIKMKKKKNYDKTFNPQTVLLKAYLRNSYILHKFKNSFKFISIYLNFYVKNKNTIKIKM